MGGTLPIMTNKPDDPAEFPLWPWITAALIALLIPSFVFGVVLQQFDLPETAAEWGDAIGGPFGVGASMAAAVLFFGAMVMQRRELRLQRDELRLQRDELAQTREVLTEQKAVAEAQKKVFERQAELAERDVLMQTLIGLLSQKNDLMVKWWFKDGDRGLRVTNEILGLSALVLHYLDHPSLDTEECKKWYRSFGPWYNIKGYEVIVMPLWEPKELEIRFARILTTAKSFGYRYDASESPTVEPTAEP
jgi:hypothetical protein